MSTAGPRKHGVDGGATAPPVAVQQTTVIQVGSQKSVFGAVLLALFFGPLGMLYATVPGALVMFVVSLIIVIPTLGLGLIVTLPACAIWAGVAASSHNRGLGGMLSTQAVGGSAAASYAAPAAWHDDPEDSGRLRYYDGTRWTDHYADKPSSSSSPPQVQIEANNPPTEEAMDAPPPTVVQADGREARFFDHGSVAEATMAETGENRCESCGGMIEQNDRFCPACGQEQAKS